LNCCAIFWTMAVSDYKRAQRVSVYSDGCQMTADSAYLYVVDTFGQNGVYLGLGDSWRLQGLQ
jgi:hypothetical protein